MSKKNTAAVRALLKRPVPDNLGHISLAEVVLVPHEGDTTLLEMLRDERPTPEQAFAERQIYMRRLTLLAEAMRQLDEPEREILFARRLKEKPLKLSAVAKQWKMTREEVVAAEAAAIGRLRQIMGIAEKASEPPKPRKTDATRPDKSAQPGTALAVVKPPR